MSRLQGVVIVEDEVSGFQYFDDRDLTGFVDGTENPVGLAAETATLVGAEDEAFAGGSYVLVQKYIHDLASWDAVATDIQEGIIGRRKLSDIELDEAAKPAWAHNTLTAIEEDGVAVEILRHNMPFGGAAQGEAGTYFIGYARTPRVLEQMIANMFVGRPPGTYDRLLDFTHPVTGTLFFAPAASLLERLANRAAGEPG
jgi:putative iron-dependent peroxidase